MSGAVQAQLLGCTVWSLNDARYGHMDRLITIRMCVCVCVVSGAVQAQLLGCTVWSLNDARCAHTDRLVTAGVCV